MHERPVGPPTPGISEPATSPPTVTGQLYTRLSHGRHVSVLRTGGPFRSRS